MHKLDPIVSKIHYKTLTVNNQSGSSAVLKKGEVLTTLELTNHKLLVNGEEGTIADIPKDVDSVVLN